MSRRGAPKNGANQINMKGLVTRRRELHEIPSKPYAIYNFCRECRGWEGNGRGLTAEVLACPNTGCILWPVRAPKCSYVAIGQKLDPYPPSDPLCAHRSDYGAKNARGRRIRDFCAECHCLRPGECRDPVRDCTDTGCHSFPWRLGKLDDGEPQPDG